MADRRRTTNRPEEQLALLDPRLLSPVFRRPSAVTRELCVKCYQIVPMAFVPLEKPLISPEVQLEYSRKRLSSLTPLSWCGGVDPWAWNGCGPSKRDTPAGSQSRNRPQGRFDFSKAFLTGSMERMPCSATVHVCQRGYGRPVAGGDGSDVLPSGFESLVTLLQPRCSLLCRCCWPFRHLYNQTEDLRSDGDPACLAQAIAVYRRLGFVRSH